MKRNMDLIRRIVLATADLPYAGTLKELSDVSPEDFIAHVIWLKEAGLVDATAQAGSGSFAAYAIVTRLTWSGCDFADACIDETLWRKAREQVFKPGLSFTFDVLKSWLKAEIQQGFPALRSMGNQVQ